MRPSGKVSAFMNQNPRKVAAFVSECLDYRRFEASDLLPYATRETLEELGLVGYQIDTFRLTMMIILMSLAWCMMPMEPSLAPLRAPPLWGHFVICNLLSVILILFLAAYPSSAAAVTFCGFQAY